MVFVSTGYIKCTFFWNRDPEVQQVSLVRVVQTVNQDQQVHVAKLENVDPQVHRENEDLQDKRDHPDPEDPGDPQGSLEDRENRG